MPPGMPPPGGGLPPGLAGIPGMPPGSMAGGLLGLAGHPGMPPTTSAAAMAAAAAAAAGGPGGLHALMRPDLRDEKPALSAMEDRLKHSASSSPHSHNNRGEMRGRSPPPGMGSSRSPSSMHGGDRRPGSNAGHHRSSTPNEEAHKRIKLEENARKAQHVRQVFSNFKLKQYMVNI